MTRRRRLVGWLDGWNSSGTTAGPTGELDIYFPSAAASGYIQLKDAPTEGRPYVSNL